MTREELLARISVDPNICFGKPCIRGHRLVCLSYGAKMSRERFVDIPVKKTA